MILLSALLLAVQPAPARKARVVKRAPVAAVVKPTTEWIRGLWVADADKGKLMEGCADWTAVFYQFDGHLLAGDYIGYWRLEGDQLKRWRMAPVEEDDALAPGSEPDKVSTIVRLSQDRLREIGPGKTSTLYLRCPKPETPVAR